LKAKTQIDIVNLGVGGEEYNKLCYHPLKLQKLALNIDNPSKNGASEISVITVKN
jgi:hypothetical protein